MDDLTKTLKQALPQHWMTAHLGDTLPPFTSVTHCSTDGLRTLLFLKVKGPVRSAMPYLDANSRYRNSGIEPIWLFEEDVIPSTKKMICAAVNWKDDNPSVAIINVGQGDESNRHAVDISEFALAASERRLKIADIQAGQRVGVSLTSDHFLCPACGSVEQRYDQASIQLVDHPGVPSLAIPWSKIGASVSGLMISVLKGQSCHKNALSHRPNQCSHCASSTHHPADAFTRKESAVGSIVLSSRAALELLKHHKTAWYIA
ncbi:hypothetical protein [Pseudomonas syringae]|uniref:hypothetical protein n=1 Tax=Pseudomonas syringae TaxID=317 RepID=UPI001F2184F3|nr:hypothetical protein [Pseudomonas syringae]MCF5371911.1 hypothetical protein [Pseudomonas syringae]MCF5382487.1 hypothetical protein [Pseudomonas syringae]MCF5419374.1 hypothetical protein [Pseudomonas syringae]MCF5451921.1 hypothetical protein [Pseudomonas syringae]MCF5460274.1 hypothetical protein [Pseudomonas syringae]